MSKIVILSGSLRKNGNTNILVKSFAEGAESVGHDVTIFSVSDCNVNPCTGCNCCFERTENTCIQRDDMFGIYQKLANADILVIASPVYFYGLSAKLKSVIDRLHNPIRNSFHIRKTALLLVGAANLPELFDSILIQYRLCLNFFHLEDAGQVLVRGVNAPGDICGRPELEQAFDLGKSI